MDSIYPLVPLHNLVSPTERPEEPIAGQIYRQVGVRLWGQGAYERETIDGSQTQYKTLNRVELGDIIVNKIWARNGSVSVVREDTTGGYVSGEFPLFVPKFTLLDPRWFYYLTKTSYFWHQCEEKSFGTSGKNRIRPEKFLEIEIPLPALSEQRRIVDDIEALVLRIEEARSLRRSAMQKVDALLSSAWQTLGIDHSRKMWIVLSNYIEKIENGWSPEAQKRPASTDEWGVLKVGAVSFGVFNPLENKALPLGLPPIPEYEVMPDDLLMSRANTLSLVGAIALVTETRPHLMLSDKIFRLLPYRDAKVDKKYLSYILKSPALRKQIEEQATGTSPTMKNISKEKVMNLRLPPHSLDEQRHIVAYLDDVQAQVKAIKQLQAETATELDALLPSVLDQAFKGNL